MEEVMNSCYDAPTSLTYKWKELAGNIVSSSKKFPRLYVKVFNQGADSDTISACTRFGIMHINNGQNILEQGNDYSQVNPKDLWMRAIKINPSIKNSGDYLQNALKQAKSEGYIAGWAGVYTIEEAKQAIDIGQYIYTGSDNGDWDSVRDKKLYKLRTDGAFVGHAFCLVDYNENGFIGLNSYGSSNGYFTIPYSLRNTLYSKNAVIDMENKEIIDQKKLEEDNKTLQLTKDLGIYNGKDGSSGITRQDTALMIGRSHRILSDKLDKIIELLENKDSSVIDDLNSLIN